mgnify:CR=1 FL=1
MPMQLGFFGELNFDEQKRLNRLSVLGDRLPRLNEVIDWESFRPELLKVFPPAPEERGGRPRYDLILMFKILILQRLYNLSDEQAEYQITDRMSFMRFLNLDLKSRVPDAKTIWAFREKLVKAEDGEKFFDIFLEKLEKSGFITKCGSIVDATFVEVPRQRNTPEENAAIKEGRVPEEWESEENKHKKAQKDTDARWTKKGNASYYGYKNHVKVDADSKLIVKSETTSANVHDSQAISHLVDESDKVLYADSAYDGNTIAGQLPPTVETRIHERAHRGHPLTEEQKASNREKSKVRVRIEHVFAAMTMSFHGLTLRCIGKARAKFNIALLNLTYNMYRYESLCRMKDRDVIVVAGF